MTTVEEIRARLQEVRQLEKELSRQLEDAQDAGKMDTVPEEMKQAVHQLEQEIRDTRTVLVKKQEELRELKRNMQDICRHTKKKFQCPDGESYVCEECGFCRVYSI